MKEIWTNLRVEGEDGGAEGRGGMKMETIVLEQQ